MGIKNNELGDSFKKSCDEARERRGMIWGKPLDGIEFYCLAIVRPGLDFKLINTESKNELIIRFKMNQTDWFYIYEELTKCARLMKNYF